MAMIQVRLPPDATLGDALRLLGLSDDDADAGFGLVPVAPGRHVLRVTDEAARRVSHELAEVFADPRIEPDDSS
ncbi:hypothetical protein ACFMQL_15060 [Nonomuraea fastidiosa]|jgi:hypothetical protein|uniref:hypothetical protein n=1 Tax=Nonomuraea TaxID=83681 RepID=UPI00324BE1D4